MCVGCYGWEQDEIEEKKQKTEGLIDERACFSKQEHDLGSP